MCFRSARSYLCVQFIQKQTQNSIGLIFIFIVKTLNLPSKDPFKHEILHLPSRRRFIFEPTCASCTVGSYASLSVCLSVCLGVPRAHYTPLQRYMGYLCTRKAQYAPLRRNMHHGAQGRLCFLKNSGDPDDFLFWWFTENIHKMCPSGKCPCGSH